jgi:hypothetical protein
MITLSFRETEPPYGCPPKETDAMPLAYSCRDQRSTMIISEGTSSKEATTILNELVFKLIGVKKMSYLKLFLSH